MSTIAPTTVRIEESLKDQAVYLLKTMGLSYNTYINMATQQLVYRKKIPFEILSDDTPNDETYKAMIGAEAKALGLISDDEPRFDNVDNLLAYLEED